VFAGCVLAEDAQFVLSAASELHPSRRWCASAGMTLCTLHLPPGAQQRCATHSPAVQLTVTVSWKECEKSFGVSPFCCSTSVAESRVELRSSKSELRAKPWLASGPKSLNCGQHTGMPPLRASAQPGLAIPPQPAELV